jgi:REP element-mobilizing transposase RayT
LSRTARRKSESGIYHVVLRGINRQTIFADDEDHEKFIQILSECKKISGYSLYGYCLMGNHVHLLIKEETEDLGKIMKRIGVRYVYWFNRKYGRSGHLFQDRFKSEPVDDDGYFMTVLEYITSKPAEIRLE